MSGYLRSPASTPRPTRQVYIMGSARSGHIVLPSGISSTRSTAGNVTGVQHGDEDEKDVMEKKKRQEAEDTRLLHSKLEAIWPHWPGEIHRRCPPSHIWIAPETVRHVGGLQRALDRALESILTRWFCDERARFPSRMPIDEREERVLRWMYQQDETVVLPYARRKGTYRPDFLFERVAVGDKDNDSGISYEENIRICEINARLPYNGYFFVQFLNQALSSWDIGRAGLEFTLEAETLWSRLFALFDTSQPVHAVAETHAGAELAVFAGMYEKHTGRPVRIIRPADLRLLPDAGSKTGRSLWILVGDDDVVVGNNVDAHTASSSSSFPCSCSSGPCSSDCSSHPYPRRVVDGEVLEPVAQLTLCLEPEELSRAWENERDDDAEDYSFALMCEIGRLCPVNDLRSIFLAKDQRLLGILLEELDDLVAVQGVLTPQEADLLRGGIVPSYAPGSSGWLEVARQCESDAGEKDGWVLKAARGAFSKGHIFGSDVDNAEWVAKMSSSAAAAGTARLDTIAAGNTISEGDRSPCNPYYYCLQARVRQVEFDIVRHDSGAEEAVVSPERFHLVGAYCTVAGAFQGLALLRLCRQVALPWDEGLALTAVTDKEEE